MSAQAPHIPINLLSYLSIRRQNATVRVTGIAAAQHAPRTGDSSAAIAVHRMTQKQTAPAPSPAPVLPEAQDAPALHNRLFFRLFQVGNTLARQTVKEVGMTTVQWAVLGALSRPQVQGGMTFSELADYLVVSRQSLDGVLKRLERAQHVERVADARDRRARRVRLTAGGAAFWESVQPRIYAFYRQAVHGLRFDDKVALVHFLNRLNEAMTQMGTGQRPEE